MKNLKFREYTRKLSPTRDERDLVEKIYQSFQNLLQKDKCFQVGSYARFTAIHPLHDLDILFIIGKWEDNPNPQILLENLLQKIKSGYVNPTKYNIDITIQPHSINIVFKNEDGKKFSADIVPAYIFSKNDSGDDTYKIPEIGLKKHGEKRTEFYNQLLQNKKHMEWIHTDPRGYIEIAKNINQENKDFRKTVKFIKKWKGLCKEKDKNFKLKSFHIEQVIVEFFQGKNGMEIFESISMFFKQISYIITSPKIEDIANSNEYIDEYVNNLNDEQKGKIKQEGNNFLTKLENFKESDSVEDLLEEKINTITQLNRKSDSIRPEKPWLQIAP